MGHDSLNTHLITFSPLRLRYTDTVLKELHERKTGRKLDIFHFLYTFSDHPLIIQFAINISSSRSVSEGFSTQTTQKTANTGNCLA